MVFVRNDCKVLVYLLEFFVKLEGEASGGHFVFEDELSFSLL